MNFETNPSQTLVSLLPAIRETKKPVTPPQGCVFVLRRGREYFLKFRQGRAVTVCSVGRSRQFDSLILAATHGQFWASQTKGEEIRVEVYKPPVEFTATDRPAAMRWQFGRM